MKALVLAAGKGRRIQQLSLSRILPKPLLPIGGKCVIDYSLELLERSGLRDVIVVVNHKEDIIREYLGDGREYGLRLDYVRQPQLDGIAGAVACASDLVGDDDFVVCLGDEVTLMNSLHPMFELFNNTGCAVVEGVVGEWRRDKIKQTNELVMCGDGSIVSIIEKPKEVRSMLRGVGLYVFRGPVMEDFKRATPGAARMEKEITDIVNALAVDGKAYGYKLGTKSFNVNTIEDYWEALEAVFPWRCLE